MSKRVQTGFFLGSCCLVFDRLFLSHQGQQSIFILCKFQTSGPRSFFHLLTDAIGKPKHKLRSYSFLSALVMTQYSWSQSPDCSPSIEIKFTDFICLSDSHSSLLLAPIYWSHPALAAAPDLWFLPTVPICGDGTRSSFTQVHLLLLPFLHIQCM